MVEHRHPLGKPLPDGETPGVYACLLRIEGLGKSGNPDGIRVYGEGPLQSLHLAMSAILTEVELFEKKGRGCEWSSRTPVNRTTGVGSGPTSPVDASRADTP